jgi:hypothetical protein
MKGVFFAEAAILVKLHSVGCVLLVLHRVEVSLLALGASQCDFNSHIGTS